RQRQSIAGVPQNLHDQATAAATYIDQGRELSEIICVDGWTMSVARNTGHSPIEERADLRFAHEIVVERHPDCPLRAALACSHGPAQLTPHTIKNLTIEKNPRFHGIGMTRPQIFAERRQSEPIAVDFLAHAETN